MPRITRLAPEQEELLPVYRDKWTRVGLSTEPGDHAVAEAAVCAAYRAAGLDSPTAFLWLPSPLHGAVAAALFSDSAWGSVAGSVWASVWRNAWESARDGVGNRVGESVRESVWASVQNSVWNSAWRNVGDSVWTCVRNSAWRNVGDSVWASVRDSVWLNVGESVRDSVRASVWLNVGESVRDSVWASVGDRVGNNVWESVRTSVEESVWASVQNSVWNSAWRNVAASVWESVRRNVGESVRDSVWTCVRDSVGTSVWESVRNSIGGSVWNRVGESVRDSVWASVWINVAASVLADVRAGAGENIQKQLSQCGFGLHDAYWLGFYQFFLDVCRLDIGSRLQPLITLAEHAGWWWPFRHACVLTEKPTALSRDEAGRLHNPSGPALDYAGTWAIYAWHGVRVPSWVITRPAESLTREDIFGLQNAEQQRALVERIGVEAFCRIAEPQVLHEDTAGNGMPRRLLAVNLPDDPDRRLVAVEVRCPSTGRVYLLRVPPDIRDCQAAVAWTFGLTPDQYQPLAET